MALFAGALSFSSTQSFPLPPSLPEQFAGAVEWAHKKSITGVGETAIIIEYFPQGVEKNAKNDLKERVVSVASPNESEEEKMIPSAFFSAAHGSWVLSILSKIAPASNFVIMSPADLPNLTKTPTSLEVSLPGDWKDKLTHSRVINFSFGGINREEKFRINQNKSTPAELKELRERISTMCQQIKNLAQLGTAKLIVVSSGNDNQDLSNPFPRLSEKEKVYDVAFSLATDLEVQDTLIMVGSLSSSYDLSLFSNYPGHNKTVQDRFLCTLGETTVSGTSFSAPIVSGAALLLKDAYPFLTMAEVQETLLESASKNFFIDKGNRRGKFVYDPQDGKPTLASFKGADLDDILMEEFNPIFYGKGVLDLRAAFIYGELLRKNKHRRLTGFKPLTKEQLRSQMKRLLKKEDTKAATTLQSAYRKHLTRKKHKNHIPPPSYKSLFPGNH